MGAWHGAICVASRSMIISGKSVWNAKKEVEDSKDKSELIKNTWPRLFKQNGYNTYMTGKWHVRLPIEKIFDSIINKRPGMPDGNRGLFAEGIRKWQKESGIVEKLSEYMPIGYGRPIDEFDKTWNPDDSIHGGFWQGGKHWSEVLADDAKDLIDNAKTNYISKLKKEKEKREKNRESWSDSKKEEYSKSLEKIKLAHNNYVSSLEKEVVTKTKHVLKENYNCSYITRKSLSL